MDDDSITVRDDPDRHRFDIVVDGTTAGFAVYQVRGSRYFFVHTEIADEYEGKGLGSQLARGALDEMRSRSATVIPLCPFIAAWIEKHPEYDDLVDHELLATLSND